jgi:glycosyltransferase involved in cell wall biosynthesis
MRILQLLPELKVGGVERGTIDLSEHLVSQGHESAVVSAGGDLVKLLNQHGARHFKLPIGKKNLKALIQIKNLRNIYNDFRPDIIHVRSRFPAWINFFALKQTSFKKPIVISTFHGLYSKPFYSKSMSYADEIIAISKTVKDYIKKNYKIDLNNLHLIYRGCDIAQFNNSKPEDLWLDNWYKDFPQTQNKILLTLPGRITSWKGIEDFLLLLTHIDLNKYHGLIPGHVKKNKERYYKSLLSLVKKYDLQSGVTFCGSRSDIENIYKISNIVFNLSSKPEPFGRTIIEAAACGTRVMGWDRGGVKESLEMINPKGLVPFGDVKQLVNEIPKMLVEEAPQTIPEIFTKNHLVKATIDIYESALSKLS